MRNRGFLVAAFALAACGRETAPPAPDPAAGVTLAAPSSSTIASPLAAETTGFTNEMQAENLRDQAAQLGISRLARPSVPGMDGGDQRYRTITYQEGIERTRRIAAEAAAERRAIEGDQNKSVALPTSTPGVLPPNKEGEPISDSSGTE